MSRCGSRRRSSGRRADGSSPRRSEVEGARSDVPPPHSHGPRPRGWRRLARRAHGTNHSVNGRRVGERTGKLDPDAAVRIGREAGGVGQLAEPAAVGAQGEDLLAVGVCADRVTAGIEDDSLRHRVLNNCEPTDAAGTASTARRASGANDGVPRVEVGDLAQPATAGVNGEQLAASERVSAERVVRRVGGGRKERPPPTDAQERGQRVHAAEVRELEEILALLEEHLVDRAGGRRVLVHWRPRYAQIDELGPQARHAEGRIDPAAWRGDGREDGPEPAAVDADRDANEVMSRVRAVEVEDSAEEDGLVVDELRATAVRVRVEGGYRASGEMRHLRARRRVGREVQDYDLDGLAAGPRPVVCEGDPTAVWA